VIEQDFLDSLNTDKVNVILAVPTRVNQSTPEFKQFEREIYTCEEMFNVLLEKQRLEKEVLEKEYGF
jgi:hypothetical protein